MSAPPNLKAVFRLERSVGKTNFHLDVNLHIPGRGITVLFGPSGSGKTTLLRCMAGLEEVMEGRMTLNDQVWQGGDFFLPVHMRKVGYIFQESNLFTHLTAWKNIDYALRRADAPAEAEEIEKLLQLLGISHLMDRYPDELSGGEKQRIAIARALLIRPDLLLMDEPLAALDQVRKQEILPYLERLREELNLPVIYVTHSLEELTRLANHVVVMEDGKIKAQGNFPADLKELALASAETSAPAESEAAVIEGKIAAREPEWNLMTVAFPGGELRVRERDGTDTIRLRVLARDVSIALSDQRDSSILNRLPAEIAEIADGSDPALAMVYLKVGETMLVARLTRRSVAELGLVPGMKVWAQIKSVAIVQ
ncbi:molybdenum ABC transporter ATP-binding protein [Emcibacter sp.]|uniref:molybdenum ABC transporter ATP-binding protein n=1 Tax=Emcibacter sp. TaxID=1979954 RepID=UPI003A8F07BB